MRFPRLFRMPLAWAAVSIGCIAGLAQEAALEQKKQPKIYTIRPTDEHGERNAGLAPLPNVPKSQSAGRLPVPNPSNPSAIRSTRASPAQTAAWIRELDATEFDTREMAMLRLLEEGPAVLSSLKPLFARGSLEATTRGLFVVRQIGLVAQLDDDDEAGHLLTELAEQKESVALARRAAAALAELTQQRSLQALTALERLGAKITPSVLDVNNPQDGRVDSIELGEDFRGGESEIKRLKWIVESPKLILSGQQVTDDWIKLAMAMPGMEELHLYRAKITEGALAPLVGHAAIKQVGIYHTPVHDAVLDPLTKLPLLAFVKLYGTQVSKEAVEKFKAISGLAVDFRRGAFMGVGAYENEGKCQIRTVHPGSPAEKGGIQVQDIIIRFGGAEVTSFGNLTDLIAPHEVGDEVEIACCVRFLATRRRFNR